MLDLDEYKDLWDGSDPAWVLVIAGEAEDDVLIFHLEQKTVAMIDDEAKKAAVVARMRERGVRTLGQKECRDLFRS